MTVSLAIVFGALIVGGAQILGAYLYSRNLKTLTADHDRRAERLQAQRERYSDKVRQEEFERDKSLAAKLALSAGKPGDAA
jgi:hypothetical protein